MAKRESTINYAYQKSVSYSQYSMYKQCNFRWYLNYVKKQKILISSITIKHLKMGKVIVVKHVTMWHEKNGQLQTLKRHICLNDSVI